jgi:hypothetical protein
MTKLSVVKNIPIPATLPTIESFGQTGPAAISNAVAISITPEAARKISHVQDAISPGQEWTMRGVVENTFGFVGGEL